jgi:hypothetical protein
MSVIPVVNLHNIKQGGMMMSELVERGYQHRYSKMKKAWKKWKLQLRKKLNICIKNHIVYEPPNVRQSFERGFNSGWQLRLLYEKKRRNQK